LSTPANVTVRRVPAASVQVQDAGRTVAVQQQRVSIVTAGVAGPASLAAGDVVTTQGMTIVGDAAGDPVAARVPFWDVTWSGATAYPDIPPGATAADTAAAISAAYATMTDSSAAIQAAITTAASLGVPVVGRGTYRVDSTITLAITADFSGATFICSNTAINPLLLVGSRDTGTRVSDLDITLPTVIQAGKTLGAGWSGSDVGVELANLYSCHVTTQRVTAFSTNLLLTAYGSNGNVYNTIDLGHLENGKIGLKLKPGDASGWVNQNKIDGGRISINSLEGTSISGARHVLIDTGANPVNNNVLANTSIEGDGPEYHAEIYGPYNVLETCRWEATPPKIALNGADAGSTVVWYGYNAHQIAWTLLNGALSTTTHHYGRSGAWLPSADRGHIYQNTTSNANPAITIMDSSASIAADRSTAYTVAIGANIHRGKRSTDANDRVQLDYQNGRLYFANGTAAPAFYFTNFGSIGLQTSGYFRVGAVTSLPTASANYRGMVIRVEGAAGVADKTYQCLKTTADTYTWVQIATG
jgi:hypothetical protein